MRCLESINTQTFSILCCKVRGATIAKWIRIFLKVMKSIVARCLYCLYTILAIWRVVKTTEINAHWLLLLALAPLALETLHTIFFNRGRANKWVTPSVFFFLLVAVPCIWLLELQLLADRLKKDSSDTDEEEEEETLTNFSNESWTLALEQMLIFVLVFSKWIAPKGKMTNQEMSQLLLVTIAAGADILELLETFGESNVSTTKETVYLVLAVWSWSLLQFCFILTTAKQMPRIYNEEELEEVIIVEVQKKKESLKESKKNQTHQNGSSPKNLMIITECNMIDEKSEDFKRSFDRIKAEEKVEHLTRGRNCFECFCCFNETWGMTMSMMFQDAPFLLTRLVILLHYRVFTHMNIFFTLKNIIVIMLLLNRIRVIIQDDHKSWNDHMKKIKIQRRLRVDEKRRLLGFSPKSPKKQTDQKAWSSEEL